MSPLGYLSMIKSKNYHNKYRCFFAFHLQNLFRKRFKQTFENQNFFLTRTSYIQHNQSFDYKVCFSLLFFLTIIEQREPSYLGLIIYEYVDHFYKPIRIVPFVNIPIDHIELQQIFLELSYRFLSNPVCQYPLIHRSTKTKGINTFIKNILKAQLFITNRREKNMIMF